MGIIYGDNMFPNGDAIANKIAQKFSVADFTKKRSLAIRSTTVRNIYCPWGSRDQILFSRK